MIRIGMTELATARAFPKEFWINAISYVYVAITLDEYRGPPPVTSQIFSKSLNVQIVESRVVVFSTG